MILQALYEYYNRSGNLPKKGTQLKEIGYLIVINHDGDFIRLESRMIDKKRASQFMVAQTVQRSGRKFIGNYLWDNCEYVTGYSDKNSEKAKLCKSAFEERVKELREKAPFNNSVQAIYNFYQKHPCVYDTLKDDILWKERLASKVA